MTEMTREQRRLGDRDCVIWRSERPRVLLLQPVDADGGAFLDAQARQMGRETDVPFLLCAFPVESWYRDLPPWDAPAVFGGESFQGGAARTLRYVSERLLPALAERWGGGMKTAVGGYSLAGLFALWCGYETALFDAVAAVSPSVWLEGWTQYAAGRAMGARAVYLSLGDREEQARNRRLARVGGCIREQKRLLDGAGVPNALVWETGSHFQNAPARTARGFVWAAEHVG